jgi:hypothetical protein
MLCWDLDWLCGGICCWDRGGDWWTGEGLGGTEDGRDGGWGLLRGSGWICGVEGGLAGGGREGGCCATSEEFMLLYVAAGSFTVCAVMKSKYIKWTSLSYYFVRSISLVSHLSCKWRCVIGP